MARDVPSHLYSFSFEQNPNWSRMFATSDEIHGYMLGVAEKHQLRDKADFGVKVNGLQYDDNTCLWTASAIQLVPAIAPEVGQLTVFQRTPSWIIPKPDYEICDAEKSIYRALPLVQQIRRTIIYALTESVGAGIVLNTPVTKLLEPLARWNIERTIQEAWHKMPGWFFGDQGAPMALCMAL